MEGMSPQPVGADAASGHIVGTEFNPGEPSWYLRIA